MNTGMLPRARHTSLRGAFKCRLPERVSSSETTGVVGTLTFHLCPSTTALILYSSHRGKT